MNIILIAKALHVVGFISWFAGLFYLGRVLVHHAETDEIPQDSERNRIKREVLQEEYSATENRVYKIIVNPAMMITWVAGLVMIGTNFSYFQAGTPGWLHLKLLLVVLLVVYQLYTKSKLMLPIQKGERPMSGWQLRLWNEVPTFFLVSVPFIAVFGKAGELNYLYLGIGVLLFSVMVYRGARAYQKKRAAA
ncbi:MAG: CopD family protein [Bacteroidota bacterium]